MKVVVVAEYYPRAGDPARGIWAHRQVLAARAAGADVRVLVLHRPVPPLAALRARDLDAALDELRQPRFATLDDVPVHYVRYLSPPRGLSYAHWGAWAAPRLRWALRALRRSFPFDLIHAHYAVPAGDAVRRAAADVPLVVSVHGHDVFGSGAGGPTVQAVLSQARVVLANSAGTAARCAEHGARATRVVHLGADVPAAPSPPPARPTLVTVGHVVERKRHADVLAALALLRERDPLIRWIVVGDGPELGALREGARRLGLERHVSLRGALPPADAAAAAREATLFVLPSVDEAFGVAYVEAMAGGVPAIGCRGEPGPEEIAAAGGGIELVAPRDVVALAGSVDRLLSDPERLARLRVAARENVVENFTWERCGQRTVAAYREALERENLWHDRRFSHRSAPYEERNVLDRLSRTETLELHYKRLEDRERSILERSLPLEGGKVLSVGAGYHPGRHLFPAPDFHLTAVDADPERVERVRATGRADEARVGHAGALHDLPDAAFDVVLYRLVLHHLVYQAPLGPVFAEAARLLKPGGTLVAIEPGLWHPVGLGLALANRTGLATALHGTPDDIPLSPGRLQDEARNAGLQPELHAVTYTWRRLPAAGQRALARLDAAGSHPLAAPLGHTLMLIAHRTS